MSFLRNSPFKIQHNEHCERIDRNTDDLFFEEAFSSERGNGEEPNASYVGSVIPKKRFVIATIVAISVLGIFVARTSALQIFQGNTYRGLAENNRMKEVILPAERGIIYDRNGIILAKNDPSFQITTAKFRLPDDELEVDFLLGELSTLTGHPKDEIVSAYNAVKDKREEFLLVDHLAYDTAMLFASKNDTFPGMHLEVSSERQYLTDHIPSLSHVLGYTAPVSEEEYYGIADEGYRRFDYIGKQGIEATYETVLRGSFGEETLEIDALGKTKRIVSKRDPVDGENLTLTIDSALQAYIERVLEDRLPSSKTERASVVALDPKSGEVLALVSWPSYDANAFAHGIDATAYQYLLNDENHPLFPRAFAGEFPSGSTIKPVYASAALIEGIITPHTTVFSTGGLRVGQWFFPDWRAGGHGTTNVYHAIADSVNTFFYMIGGGYESFEGLGVERLMQYAALFGFGSKSGIDLTGEADGFLPSKEWKAETIGEQWYIGDTYNTSIGQGYFLVTPLQIARSTAVFANGGALVTPHVNQALQPSSPLIIDENTVKVIKDAMRETVTNGSATSLQQVPVPVSGKTGTAQWSNNHPPHSWFTGFAPYDDPEIVLTVLVEEGGDDSVAVPVSRDILTWWFSQN